MKQYWRGIVEVTVGGVLIVVATLYASSLRAQSLSPAAGVEGLAFDVASVKVNTSGENAARFQFQAGGRFVAVNAPVSLLISAAFGASGQALPDSRMSGGPSWIRTDRFDIEAKAAGNPDAAQALGMLRAFLADRFKLVVHMETVDRPMYALVLARGDRRLGPQLRAVEGGCAASGVEPGDPSSPAAASAGPRTSWIDRPRCGVSFRPGNVIGGAATMAQIASALATVIRQPVRDDTGLTGAFNVDLAWTPDQSPRPPDIDPNGPSIFTALQEQLGLKLDSIKGAVDVLVIDRVEHPTVN